MATAREQLAKSLRQSRIDAGYLSHQLLAKVLNVSRSIISRAENPNEAVPSPGLIARWADVTGADVDALNDLAKRARNPRSLFIRWSDDFEQRATLIRWFEPMLVPGLAQCKSYARAVASWKPFRAETEGILKERLARQSVLDRAEFRMLLLQSVLSREVGNTEIMHEQITHLLNLGERPNITLQLVPDVPEIAGALGGAFAIATQGSSDTAVFTDSTVQSSVYTDDDALTRATLVWDGLHANALPWTMTRDLLVQAGERYERQRTELA